MQQNPFSIQQTAGHIWFGRTAIIATILALVVVVLGAYTRLSDAGLGCPDWPGCYGQLTVPQNADAIARAEAAFPGQVVVPAKAWPEMIHRYVASTLGLLILSLAFMTLRHWRYPTQPKVLPLLLVGLVVFQALLGMWTVTLLLYPLVVMGHLMGGMTLLALLWWLALRHFAEPLRLPALRRYLPWAILGLVLVYAQIMLGGWTAANYASLACPDFPYCQGKLVPAMDVAGAFNVLQPLGVNYEGGVLNNSIRMTINTFHRFGSIIVASFLLIFALVSLMQRRSQVLHVLGLLTGLILVIQMSLGVVNITHLLPLQVAVMHNAFGALLLLVMVTLCYVLSARQKGQ